MHAQKRDTNEPEIITTLRGCFANVQQMDKSAGFDLLVYFRGAVHVAEIKNPEYKPKKKSVDSMLTDDERETKEIIESTGCTYNILFTPDDALEMIGVHPF